MTLLRENFSPRSFRLHILARATMLVMGTYAVSPGYAGTFDPAFLETFGSDTSVADLSRFSAESGAQLPGIYRVDIYVNDRQIDTRELFF